MVSNHGGMYDTVTFTLCVGTIRRNRRDGDVEIELEEVKLLEQRFTRIGKEKAQSGHAYKEMTEHVICTGTD